MTEKIFEKHLGCTTHDRFLSNLSWNLAYFGVGIALGIWYTPYLVRHLGTNVFGLFPLVTQLVSYMTLITFGLNAALGRNLTISVATGNEAEANSIFNTSFWGGTGIIAILAILGCAASCFAEYLIRVPEGYILPARYLMGATVVSFLLNLLATPFNSSTFCKNRFDISNSLMILQQMLTVVLVVLLFSTVGANLYVMAAAVIFAAVFNLGRSIVVQRSLLPYLHIRWGLFDHKIFQGLVSFGGWMIINQIGTLLYLAIDLIVVNRMLGPEAGGDYAIVLQWSILLRTFGGTIAGVFGPTILYYYAGHDFVGLVNYSRQAVKLVGLAIALPIGLVSGLSAPILTVWLRDPKYAALAGLMSLLTCHLCINIAVYPLFNIQNATAKVKLPGIITCVMGILNLVMAILMCGPVGLGVYGVALAGFIMLTAKNAIFTPIYGANILKLPWWTFCREVYITAALTLAVTGGSFIVSQFVNLASWTGLITFGAIASISYVIVVWFVFLGHDERESAMNIIHRYLSRCMLQSEE
jgi:membrane protein EpsK